MAVLVEAVGVLVFVADVAVFAAGFPITMLLLPFMAPIAGLAWVQLRAADRVRRGQPGGAYSMLCLVAVLLGVLLLGVQLANLDRGSSSAWLFVAITILCTLPSLAALLSTRSRTELISPPAIGALAALVLVAGVVVILTIPRAASG